MDKSVKSLEKKITNLRTCPLPKLIEELSQVDPKIGKAILELRKRDVENKIENEIDALLKEWAKIMKEDPKDSDLKGSKLLDEISRKSDEMLECSTLYDKELKRHEELYG